MSDSFSGYKRRYIGGATADSVKFLQRFAPSVNQDAATKKYVDDAAAASNPPGGADTNVQYNDNGSFGGDAGFVFDSGTGTATATNIIASGDLDAAAVTASNDLDCVGVSVTSTVSAPTIDVSTLNAGSVSCTNYNSTTITLTGTGSAPAINTSTNTSTANLVVTDSLLVGSGTADASALVTANSTTRGFRFPPVTTAAREAIASPAAGLTVFDTDVDSLMVFNGTNWVFGSRKEPTSAIMATMSTGVGQTGVTAGTVVVFFIQQFAQGSAISYNTTTGVFSLTGGRRYRLAASAQLINASNNAEFAWAISGGAVIGSGQRSYLTPVNLASNVSSGGSEDILYSPVSDTDVVYRCIAASAAVDIRSGSHCIVHEVL